MSYGYDLPQLPALPVKSQSVRILDIVLIAPLMLWAGYQVAKSRKGAPALAGMLLAAFGVSTLLFNAWNYLRIRQAGGFDPDPLSGAPLGGTYGLDCYT